MPQHLSVNDSGNCRSNAFTYSYSQHLKHQKTSKSNERSTNFVFHDTISTEADSDCLFNNNISCLNNSVSGLVNDSFLLINRLKLINYKSCYFSAEAHLLSVLFSRKFRCSKFIKWNWLREILQRRNLQTVSGGQPSNQLVLLKVTATGFKRKLRNNRRSSVKLERLNMNSIYTKKCFYSKTSLDDWISNKRFFQKTIFAKINDRDDFANISESYCYQFPDHKYTENAWDNTIKILYNHADFITLKPIVSSLCIHFSLGKRKPLIIAEHNSQEFYTSIKNSHCPYYYVIKLRQPKVVILLSPDLITRYAMNNKSGVDEHYYIEKLLSLNNLPTTKDQTTKHRTNSTIHAKYNTHDAPNNEDTTYNPRKLALLANHNTPKSISSKRYNKSSFSIDSLISLYDQLAVRNTAQLQKYKRKPRHFISIKITKALTKNAYGSTQQKKTAGNLFNKQVLVPATNNTNDFFSSNAIKFYLSHTAINHDSELHSFDHEDWPCTIYSDLQVSPRQNNKKSLVMNKKQILSKNMPLSDYKPLSYVEIIKFYLLVFNEYCKTVNNQMSVIVQISNYSNSLYYSTLHRALQYKLLYAMLIEKKFTKNVNSLLQVLDVQISSNHNLFTLIYRLVYCELSYVKNKLRYGYIWKEMLNFADPYKTPLSKIKHDIACIGNCRTIAKVSQLRKKLKFSAFRGFILLIKLLTSKLLCLFNNDLLFESKVKQLKQKYSLYVGLKLVSLKLIRKTESILNRGDKILVDKKPSSNFTTFAFKTIVNKSGSHLKDLNHAFSYTIRSSITLLSKCVAKRATLLLAKRLVILNINRVLYLFMSSIVLVAISLVVSLRKLKRITFFYDVKRRRIKFKIGNLVENSNTNASLEDVKPTLCQTRQTILILPSQKERMITILRLPSNINEIRSRLSSESRVSYLKHFLSAFNYRRQLNNSRSLVSWCSLIRNNAVLRSERLQLTFKAETGGFSPLFFLYSKNGKSTWKFIRIIRFYPLIEEVTKVKPSNTLPEIKSIVNDDTICRGLFSKDISLKTFKPRDDLARLNEKKVMIVIKRLLCLYIITLKIYRSTIISISFDLMLDAAMLLKLRSLIVCKLNRMMLYVSYSGIRKKLLPLYDKLSNSFYRYGHQAGKKSLKYILGMAKTIDEDNQLGLSLGIIYILAFIVLHILVFICIVKRYVLI